MCKVPGYLKKVFLAPVFSTYLLPSKEKWVNNKIFKMLKRMGEQDRKDWYHMKCQSPQVVVGVDRLTGFTVTLTVPMK